MNIREISDIFKDTADNITAIKSYNFGWASDRVRQGNTEDFQELNEFPRVFFAVPTITGSDQTRKQDTYQVTIFFDDLLGYDNEGDEDPTLQIDKWANLQQYANYFVQRLNKIKQSILPNYLFIPEAPSITFDSFTGLQRMITVQLSFNLVVPTNCDPGVIAVVQCIANIVTSSKLTASLTTVLKFAASLEGTATVTADINFVQKVASSLNANASLLSNLQLAKNVESSIAASSLLNSDLKIAKNAEALLNANGTLVSDLKIAKNAEALLNANASLTGDINFVQKVASSLNANALLSGDISFVKNAEANLSSLASLTGDINFVQKAQASLLTSANVTGNITIPKTFNASLLATGTTTADLTVGAAASLLLDLYPSAAAAYSLRKLRTAYTGSAVRVRASTSGAEGDVSFDVNSTISASSTVTVTAVGTSGLSIGQQVTFTTFWNAGGTNQNVFVTTWYDQSGNARNSTQTTQANQPQIVSSGVVILRGSKPSLLFDGTNDYIDASGVNTGNPKSIFIATRFTEISGSEKVIFDSVTTNQAILYRGFDNLMSIGFGSFTSTLYSANTAFILYSIMHNGSNSNAYVNSTSQILTNTNLGTNSFNGLRMASTRGAPSLFYNGNISEFIIYGSNESTNRTGIETNINTHYAIY